MKKFNIGIMLVWLLISLCATNRTPTTQVGIENQPLVPWMMSMVTTEFNRFIWGNCTWCTVPDDKVIVTRESLVFKEGNTDPELLYSESIEDQYTDLNDTRMTRTILVNTMPLLLAFLAMLNIAYYAGNGSVSRFYQTSLEKWRSMKFGPPEESEENSPPKELET